MSIYDFEGTYHGHVWSDADAELSFAFHDLTHAYSKLINVPLTAIRVCEEKKEMDKAMDRLFKSVVKAQNELRPWTKKAALTTA